VSVDDGIIDAIRSARSAGAAIVAAHPYDYADVTPMRATRRFALERETFEPLVDRWELFNRREVFAWIASQGLPGIATGDVHDERQVSSGKTPIPAAKDEEAVIAYLRSAGRTYLTPFAAEEIAAAAVAA